MRIGMLSTPFIAVPPPAYGGTELIVSDLCDGLRARGHEVLLYTVGDGAFPGVSSEARRPTESRRTDNRRVYEQPVWPPNPHHELEHVASAIADLLREREPVDVIHTHCPTALPLRRFIDAPFVYTMHHERNESLLAFYTRQRDVHFVAISARQRQLLPELGSRTSVVLHGLDVIRYPLGEGGRRAAFLGRFSAQKAPHLAIDAARRADVPLRMAGRPHAGDESYWTAEVAPRLSWAGVECVGEARHEQKLSLLQTACALLFPIAWEEPFGLVTIEAMLCGTPVIAFGRGAVPEIVDEGITGWVCRDVDEMAARLASAASFDRARCRAQAVRRFSRERMIADYLAIYERAVAGAGLARRGRPCPVGGVAAVAAAAGAAEPE